MKYEIEFPENYVKPVLPMGKEWVAALRSGKYQQGTQFLRYTDEEDKVEKQCCLGVICLLQQRPFKIEGNKTVFDYSDCTLSRENPLYKIFGPVGYFPPGVRVFQEKWDVYYYSLSGLNDLGFSFAEIADIIEAIWDCQ